MFILGVKYCIIIWVKYIGKRQSPILWYKNLLKLYLYYETSVIFCRSIYFTYIIIWKYNVILIEIYIYSVNVPEVPKVLYIKESFIDDLLFKDKYK